MSAPGPSRQVLDETPPRVLRFLTAVSRSPEIRAALAGSGYGAADHQEACELLLRLLRYREPPPGPVEPPAVAARAELDTWYERHGRLIRAALQLRYPAQAQFLLTDLAGAGEGQGLVAVVLLLDRLDALEQSPARLATREEDHEVLALLARRGITAEERARLRDVTVHGRGNDVSSRDPEASSHLAEQQETLRALHFWYREWSETARAVISRRDLLVRLGLLRRQREVEGKEKKSKAPGRKRAKAK